MAPSEHQVPDWIRLDVTVVGPFETHTGITRVMPDGCIYTNRRGRCMFTEEIQTEPLPKGRQA